MQEGKSFQKSEVGRGSQKRIRVDDTLLMDFSQEQITVVNFWKRFDNSKNIYPIVYLLFTACVLMIRDVN